MWKLKLVKSFQFFKQSAWFHENNRAMSKFLYGILHYLFSIIKLQSTVISPQNSILY